MKYKLLFHICALLLIATEAYRTFLLSPMPGSQEVPMVETSYFLWHYRWYIRIALLIGMIIGFRKAFEKRRWIPVVTILLTATVFYLANFEMTAEAFFKQPESVAFAPADEGTVPMDALVIGVTFNGESKAYPIRYLSFHHFVFDSVGGQNILVTYCDVCRSGIVFDPTVDEQPARFRLVGMDQFNAMLEDQNTGTWFMQANGQGVAGKKAGYFLAVIPSEQLSLSEWSVRHPGGKVMLPDPKYADHYDDGTFEKGKSTDPLTKTDTASWQDKSWVIGVEYNGYYRAYDWNLLKRQQSIHDTLANNEIMLSVDSAGINYTVLRRVAAPDFSLHGDSILFTQAQRVVYQPDPALHARQMFWHTWKTFYPSTSQYGVK